MHTQVEISGHAVNIELTPAALRSLPQQASPLIAEMELYFSCLIRKKVRFYNTPTGVAPVYVNDKLGICFRPVMTKVCARDYEGEEPPLTDFPIHKADSFIPKWLKIDYCHGEWQGEFGFT